MVPLRVLSLVEISSAFPVFCICHFIIKVWFSISVWTMGERSWKHRLLYSCFKCFCFVNKIFNILGELGLDTRVQDIFTYKHLYPPCLLGVTQALYTEAHLAHWLHQRKQNLSS